MFVLVLFRFCFVVPHLIGPYLYLFILNLNCYWRLCRWYYLFLCENNYSSNLHCMMECPSLRIDPGPCWDQPVCSTQHRTIHIYINNTTLINGTNNIQGLPVNNGRVTFCSNQAQYKEPTCFLGSIVVSIPACHAGDRGSIPRRGGFFMWLLWLPWYHGWDDWFYGYDSCKYWNITMGSFCKQGYLC